MMDDHVLAPEASLLHLSSLVFSRQPSGQPQHTCGRPDASSSVAARCRRRGERGIRITFPGAGFRHEWWLIRPRRRPPSLDGLLRQRHQRRPPCLRPPRPRPLRHGRPRRCVLRAPLNQLPWDIAQSVFGQQGADFIGVMGGLLLRERQFQLAAYRVDSTADTARLRLPCAQSPIPPAAYLSGSSGEAESDATGIPPT